MDGEGNTIPRRLLTLVVIMVCAIPLTGLGQVQAAVPALPGPEATTPASERLLVRVHDLTWSQAVSLVSQTSPRSVSTLPELPGTLVAEYQTPAEADRARSGLVREAGVAWAEFDAYAGYTATPDDALYGQQIWATSIDLPGAWSITTGQPSIIVAVLDSGVSFSHPDLEGKLLLGYDIVDDDLRPDDDVGHGTAVAGIIAARGNDGRGIAGVAMGTMILPVRVGSAEGARVTDIAAGIRWAVDRGAHVINLSLVTESPSLTLQEAVDYAWERNVPIVTPAGNDPDQVTYPSAYAAPISVGATTIWGDVASYSSRENRVDLVAPGGGIMTTRWSADGGDDWATVSGTSFAAPMVSGAIALAKTVDPTLTVEEIRSLLVATATPILEDGVPVPGSGAGQLDAGALLQRLLADAFEAVRSPADDPVAMGLTGRTWIWGPSPISTGFEEYDQSPNGQRLVRYYDKGRLEVTNPQAGIDNPWYVTSGRLAWELMTGQVQLGDDRFRSLGPAGIVVAGDPADPNAPTYRDLRLLMELPPGEEEGVITRQIQAGSGLADDPRFAGYGVTSGWLAPETNHRVASVFWAYLLGEGLLIEDGQLGSGPLFEPAFAITGLPITEAAWTHVQVNGVSQDVLVQCFERRCLTYTPANLENWRVEMANVGAHYYDWRYAVDDSDDLEWAYAWYRRHLSNYPYGFER
jgi:subtilisin family serine protease